jgi:hypothetical protein
MLDPSKENVFSLNSRRGAVIVKDTRDSEWIYVIKCVSFMIFEVK